MSKIEYEITIFLWYQPYEKEIYKLLLNKYITPGYEIDLFILPYTTASQ